MLQVYLTVKSNPYESKLVNHEKSENKFREQPEKKS